jgi:hypothetical protein
MVQRLAASWRFAKGMHNDWLSWRFAKGTMQRPDYATFRSRTNSSENISARIYFRKSQKTAGGGSGFVPAGGLVGLAGFIFFVV